VLNIEGTMVSISYQHSH